MNTLTVRKEMLYCPKCKREYQDGSQRFCNNDGGRLLPAGQSNKKHSRQQKGVFTSLLGRAPSRSTRDESISGKSPGRNTSSQRKGFEPPVKSKVFRSERVLAPEIKSESVQEKKPGRKEAPVLEIEAPKSEETAARVQPKNVAPAQKPNPQEPARNLVRKDSKPAKVSNQKSREDVSRPSADPVPKLGKPIARLIDPRDIASGRAPLGDRSINPSGRDAVTSGAPGALVGQVVKGRYKITKTIRSDRSSIAYLAEDLILKGKHVVVRVLMNSTSSGSFEDKIFLEERISLSHVNHPNVAKVIDSGELPEGMPFIVTSELRENSVETLIHKAGDLNPMRIARIVRQASYALSEIHQNGILHRNLKPEHILLTVSEAGVEQVKVTDFCVSDGSVDSENFRFKAPEQIGGQLPTFASDSYALAVIAFHLLTRRFPFEGDTERKVLAAQKSGLVSKPSELNAKLTEDVDLLFVKALSYDASKRFPKSRDFGELLFDALTGEALPEEIEAQATTIPPLTEISEAAEARHLPENAETSEIVAKEKSGMNPDMRIGSTDVSMPSGEKQEEGTEEIEGPGQPGTKEALWQNRSPEPATEKGLMWTLLSLAGLLILVLGVIGVWSYFFRTSNNPDPAIVGANQNPVNQGQGVDSPTLGVKLPESEIETPPPPRQVPAPPNTIYFENTKTNMSEELSNQFRGFSVYYPETWKRKLVDKKGEKVDDKFLDVAISDKNGIPIEHFMISPYKSNGTFKTDTELFPDLVEKSNKDISGSAAGAEYKVITQGATTIQDGRWKAYEVNFELKGVMDSKPFYIWGRRLWIPIQRPGAKTGFILTMLATSLSKDVKSADDVGKKGDLKRLVQTFEPVQEF